MTRVVDTHRSPPVMELPASPEERANALAERERHLQNVRWYASRAAEIGRTHAGKFVCVAGEELFVGTDPKQVYEEARVRHPEDRGAFFCKFISTHRGPKVYAHRWLLATR